MCTRPATPAARTTAVAIALTSMTALLSGCARSDRDRHYLAQSRVLSPVPGDGSRLDAAGSPATLATIAPPGR